MTATPHALLLVEDNLDDEALSLRAIKTCGVPCMVRVERHGFGAVGVLLAAEGPIPDLIVLDFHLPDLNGLEILREIRKHEKTEHVPVVILSSLAPAPAVTSRIFRPRALPRVAARTRTNFSSRLSTM